MCDYLQACLHCPGKLLQRLVVLSTFNKGLLYAAYNFAKQSVLPPYTLTNHPNGRLGGKQPSQFVSLMLELCTDGLRRPQVSRNIPYCQSAAWLVTRCSASAA